jgi:hypothetical protein
MGWGHLNGSKNLHLVECAGFSWTISLPDNFYDGKIELSNQKEQERFNKMEEKYRATAIEEAKYRYFELLKEN